MNCPARYIYVDPAGQSWYIHKTNVKSYVVTDCYALRLEDMVEVGGEYHFGTLQQLREEIGKQNGHIKKP